MKKVILLQCIMLLLYGCTTGQDNSGFPVKIKVTVKNERNNIIPDQQVGLLAAYYRYNSLQEAYAEWYQVTTNAEGEATIVRGKGYKREGVYDSIKKWYAAGIPASMHLFLLNEKEYEIKELGIFRSERNPDRRLMEDEGETMTTQVVEAPPQVQEKPTEDDRLTGEAVNGPLKFSNWYFVRYITNTVKEPVIETTPKKGYFEQVASGLKMYTGVTLGNWIADREKKEYAGRTVYIKWKAETNQHSCEMNWKLYSSRADSAGAWLSSNPLALLRINWPGNSNYAINYKNREWLYTRIVFDKNGWVITTTATGNYDNSGGVLLNTQKRNCSFTKGYFGWRFDDLRTVSNSWVIVGDINVTSH